MASAVHFPRQLAPTVGPSAASAGALFRTGPYTSSGERVASGLVLRFGSLDIITDNAACFADSFVDGGSIIDFGSFSVYIAVVPGYPREVLVFPDAPSADAGCASSSPDPCRSMGVFATGDRVVSGSGSQGDGHSRRPVLERPIAGSGVASRQVVAEALDTVLQDLRTPINPSVNPATAAAELDAARQRILYEAETVAASQRRLEASLREFNHVHGGTPAAAGPSRLGQVQRRGGDLGNEMLRDGQAGLRPAAAMPVYSTPAKNMRAAEAASRELEHLEGEELRW